MFTHPSQPSSSLSAVALLIRCQSPHQLHYPHPPIPRAPPPSPGRNKNKSDKEALEDISERKQLKFDARAEEQKKSGKDDLPPVKSLVRTKSVVFGTLSEMPETKLASAVKNDLAAKQQIRANVEVGQRTKGGGWVRCEIAAISTLTTYPTPSHLISLHLISSHLIPTRLLRTPVRRSSSSAPRSTTSSG